MLPPLPDRLPLVVGVTGHRDLRDEDIPLLEREVNTVFASLRRDFLGKDDETPVIVLSALAEGADRLVARVAVAQGARLIVPLPMPLDEYRRDFEPGLKLGNIAEFDELFAHAIAAPVMPLHAASVEALRADQDKRDAQYRALGIFIVQHCHVLLALWDGNEKEPSPGGSAEVVAFKRDGIPLNVSGSPRMSLDASEIGPVIEILTPRMKNAEGTAEIAVRPWGKDVIGRYRGSAVRRGWRAVATFIAHFLWREVRDDGLKLPARERQEFASWENFEVLIGLTRHFNQDAALLSKRGDGAAHVAQSLDSLLIDSHGRPP